MMHCILEKFSGPLIEALASGLCRDKCGAVNLGRHAKQQLLITLHGLFPT